MPKKNGNTGLYLVVVARTKKDRAKAGVQLDRREASMKNLTYL